MARYRLGEGEYRYLADPLPEPVDELRHALYPHLLPIARDWYTKLGRPTPWPDEPRRMAGDVPHGRADEADPAHMVKYGAR